MAQAVWLVVALPDQRDVPALLAIARPLDPCLYRAAVARDDDRPAG